MMRNRLIKYSNRVLEKYLYQRSFSVSSTNSKPFDIAGSARYSPEEGHVRTSPFQSVTPTNVTLDQYVFQNYEKWQDKTALVSCIRK